MAAAAEKIEDSNLANYGSKEHKDLRAAAADLENAWDGAGDSAGACMCTV